MHEVIRTQPEMVTREIGKGGNNDVKCKTVTMLLREKTSFLSQNILLSNVKQI